MSASFNSNIDVTIEAGFGSGPYAVSPTWVDISSAAAGFSIRRGRTHSLDRVSASTLSLALDNRAGDFDPTNIAGSHYPGVLPMVPIRVRATHLLTTYDLFYGFVESWPLTWSLGGLADMSLSAMDAMKLLHMVNTNGAEVQESTGVRVGHLLDDAGFPAGWRSLATGDVTAAAFTPACSSILTLIRQVEDTEAGLFLIDGAGQAVFQDQTHRVGALVQHTFGENVSEIPYTDIGFSFDDLQIRNRVEVQRAGGATVASEDTASIASYGEHLLQRFDTLHIDDTASTALSASLLARYKDPHVVLDTLTVNPEGADAWTEMLGLKISDLVTVMRRPTAGNTIDLDLFVESITTTVDMREQSWDATLTGTQYV